MSVPKINQGIGFQIIDKPNLQNFDIDNAPLHFLNGCCQHIERRQYGFSGTIRNNKNITTVQNWQTHHTHAGHRPGRHTWHVDMEGRRAHDQADNGGKIPNSCQNPCNILDMIL